MNLVDEVREAGSRLSEHVIHTPVVRSDALSDLTGADVRLKLETLQRTGSFKYRGALNRLLDLDASEKRRGVVTASTGNHGLAVLRAASETGTTVEIWVPESADDDKVAALADRGARVVVRGRECAESEMLAREEAERSGRVYVSAYNDDVVVAGQGTVGAEILEDVPDVTAIIASVGGGGLISGIAGFVSGVHPGTRTLGVLPANSPAMYASVRAGRVVEAPVEPTLSDATAGGVEQGAVTFELCRDLVSGWTLVDEEEIASGMHLLFREGHVAEGAAGLAAAGAVRFAREAVIDPGDVVCVVLCGRNIAPGRLLSIVADVRASERR